MQNLWRAAKQSLKRLVGRARYEHFLRQLSILIGVIQLKVDRPSPGQEKRLAVLQAKLRSKWLSGKLFPPLRADSPFFTLAKQIGHGEEAASDTSDGGAESAPAIEEAAPAQNLK